MRFLSIDPKNYNDVQKEFNDETPISFLNSSIKNGDKIFILFYMVGCGPCEATIPDKYKNNNKYSNVLVVDIDKDLFSEVKGLDFQLAGFPTIKYISDGGKKAVDYEDSTIKVKDRTIDSFVNWIQSTVDKQSGGFVYSRNKNKHNSASVRQHTSSRKSFRGGKWSRKYKKSINCKKPKGFSQKQYCKSRKHTRR